MLSATGSWRAFDVSRLDRVLCHDADRGLLEVQAGTPWTAVPGGAGFPEGTVGESVAANCPGPDGRPVVCHLRGLTLVTPDGELRRASRERSPELFALAVGGLGAFGPFYSLTFDLASLAGATPTPAVSQVLAPPSERAAPRDAEMELLLPPRASDGFIRDARTAIEERRCVPTFLEARTTLAESETYLRWARRDYVALRIGFRARSTLGACVGTVQLRARLLELAVAAGGSFMPADLAFATRIQAEACYPMFGRFLEEKRRLDAGLRIAPSWYRHACRVWRGESCTVRWSTP